MVAKSVLDVAIKRIEQYEKKEQKRKERQSNLLEKQRAVEAARLTNLLVDRKGRLKLQILRKREIFEEMILQEVRMEMEEDVDIFDDSIFPLEHGQEISLVNK